MRTSQDENPYKYHPTAEEKGGKTPPPPEPSEPVAVPLEFDRSLIPLEGSQAEAFLAGNDVQVSFKGFIPHTKTRGPLKRGSLVRFSVLVPGSREHKEYAARVIRINGYEVKVRKEGKLRLVQDKGGGYYETYDEKI